MTEKFYAFSRFFYSILNREYKARENWTATGRGRYAVKINTYEKLQRLALDVVNDSENVEAVTALQREAVAFVLRVDRLVFNDFLARVNGRYLVMTQFYPQCVAEFCYNREWLPVAEWASEIFPKAEEASETEETTEASETVEETSETTTEASETIEETAGASTTSDPVEWPTFSPVERFFDVYSGHLRAELVARSVGTHALMDSEGFRELRAYAQAVRGDEETYFGLTIMQQTLTSAVASMASLRLFNRLHTKASSDALSRFTSELVLGNGTEVAPEPKTTASEPEAKREGAEVEDDGGVPQWAKESPGPLTWTDILTAPLY